MPRETRIKSLMDKSGMDRMQAIRVVQQQDYFGDTLRRNPRAFDSRFI